MSFLKFLAKRDVHGEVWRLAFPIMLSNITVPLLGIVDTAVVGHLPDPHHIGAVAVGAMIFGVVFWGFGFLRMGTTGLTAQSFGADDNEEIRAVLGRAMFLAFGFGVLLLLLQSPVAWAAFSIIDASDAVEQEGRVYYFIRILSAPATLANYVILGWFLGMQNARVPLILLLIVNGINIVLDLVFVTQMGMAADGVAWASVIAEYIGLVCGVVFVLQVLKQHPGKWCFALIKEKQKLLSLLSLNKDIFIRTLCLMFTLAFFTAQGARYGELILAANAVLFQLHTFMAYCLDGLSHAVEALVGRTVGQKNKQMFNDVIVSAGFWAVVVSLFFACLCLLLGDQLVALITDITQVREIAYDYVLWVAILPLVSVWGFLFDGIYLGATRAREMRNTMLFATILVFLPAWYIFSGAGVDSKGLGLGNHGLWLAFILFMIARGVSMAWVFGSLHRAGKFVRF